MIDLTLVSSADLLEEIQRRHPCVMAWMVHDEDGPKARYRLNCSIVEALGLHSMLGRFIDRQLSQTQDIP